MITVVNNEPISINSEEEVPMSNSPIVDETPSMGGDNVVGNLEEPQNNEPKEDYHDPKYLNVLKALDELGFIGSKFLGDQGYYIPVNPDYPHVRLICQSVKDGFAVNIRGCIANPASAIEYAGELTSVGQIADQLNFILSGATDASTKDRHVNESTKYIMEVSDSEGTIKNLITYVKELASIGHSFPVEVDPGDKERAKHFYIDGDGADRIIDFSEMNESVIQSGDAEFGKPGTYILFRNGVDKTLRGLISFADHFQGADIYKNQENPLPTKKYLVKIENPLVINAQTSVGAFRTAYKTIMGKEVNLDKPNKTINDMWRAADKQMAAGLKKAGYDALIYKVPNANEVLVVGTDISKIPAISEYTESVKNVANTSD